MTKKIDKKKYYDCKISFRLFCDKMDLKLNEIYMHNFIKENFWKIYNVKFTYKKRKIKWQKK